ncbi:DUF6265 family protein [Xanthomarina sp.]|uniref:DUF6265 family protein n=1 Tax=Xanthomarina sp. TaxID=1931211 RepID=UPI002BC38359|nr:DUF6265 family protein [Xanthomarina sp.]HLV38779.1 DUF6265 family protein [Xanthomarina sp.]
MKKLFFITCIFVGIVACKNERQPVEVTIKGYDKIEKLQWLIGNWSHLTNQKQSYENWTKINDSTLFSHSFILVENDTVFAEHLTLEQNKDNVFLTVVAYNEKNEEPVVFKMLPLQKDVFTFENPEHDFPTRISYSNPEKDVIHAWIEGTIDGDFMKVDFKFKRN